MSEKNYAGKEGIAKIRELIQHVRIAMLTTVTEEGRLRARPMANPDRPFDGELWFLTRADASKSDEIRHDSEVLVTYSEPKEGKFLALSGRAAMVRDKGLVQEHWTPAAKAWFPDGPEDPAVALIRVTVKDAEYWESTGGAIVRAGKLALAVIAGADKVDLGDTGKIQV